MIITVSNQFCFKSSAACKCSLFIIQCQKTQAALFRASYPKQTNKQTNNKNISDTAISPENTVTSKIRHQLLFDSDQRE